MPQAERFRKFKKHKKKTNYPEVYVVDGEYWVHTGWWFGIDPEFRSFKDPVKAVEYTGNWYDKPIRVVE